MITVFLPIILATKGIGYWEEKTVRNHGAAYRKEVTSCSSKCECKLGRRSCTRRENW